MNAGDLLGRYRLVGRLAHGAMGEVWEGEAESLGPVPAGTRVAIKMIPDFLSGDRALAERLRREAQAVGQLDHPGVVRLFECGEDDGRLFLVMELLAGETLAERLARVAPLPIPEIESLARGLAEALAYVHSCGIVHRDLKPQNIFLTKDGGVKLIDLGVAKILDEASLTVTGSHFGTPAYMSPEAFRDSKYVTAAADIWALGVILYETATGGLPFTGHTAATIIARISDTNITPQDPARLRPEIPHALAGAIGRCLDRDPSRRPAAADLVFEWTGQRPARTYRRRDEMTFPDRLPALLLAALAGAAGGAANASLCFLEIPEAVGVKEASFEWHIVPAGSVHGAVLAAGALLAAILLGRKSIRLRLASIAFVGWIAGWLSYISLQFSMDGELGESLLWPFQKSWESLWVPFMYFGLVGGLYFAFLSFARPAARGRWVHFLAGVSAGVLGSLWWWTAWGPWYFCLLHGGIWGTLVGLAAGVKRESLFGETLPPPRRDGGIFSIAYVLAVLGAACFAASVEGSEQSQREGLFAPALLLLSLAAATPATVLLLAIRRHFSEAHRAAWRARREEILPSIRFAQTLALAFLALPLGASLLLWQIGHSDASNFVHAVARGTAPHRFTWLYYILSSLLAIAAVRRIHRRAGAAAAWAGLGLLLSAPALTGNYTPLPALAWLILAAFLVPALGLVPDRATRAYAGTAAEILAVLAFWAGLGLLWDICLGFPPMSPNTAWIPATLLLVTIAAAPFLPLAAGRPGLLPRLPCLAAGILAFLVWPIYAQTNTHSAASVPTSAADTSPVFVVREDTEVLLALEVTHKPAIDRNITAPLKIRRNKGSVPSLQGVRILFEIAVTGDDTPILFLDFDRDGFPRNDTGTLPYHFSRDTTAAENVRWTLNHEGRSFEYFIHGHWTGDSGEVDRIVLALNNFAWRARVEVAGETREVIVFDREMDGRISPGDAWILRRVGDGNQIEVDALRGLEEPYPLAGGRALRLGLSDSSPLRARLGPFEAAP